MPAGVQPSLAKKRLKIKECVAMYAIMRRIKIQPHLMEEAIQKTEQFFVQPLSKEPGFLKFYSVRVGESEFVSISLFETRETAEEGNRKALEWARENLFPLAQGPAEIVGGGEVLLHQKKEPQAEREIS
jgi:heme-degrading monooxygenase HmoA